MRVKLLKAKDTLKILKVAREKQFITERGTEDEWRTPQNQLALVRGQRAVG